MNESEERLNRLLASMSRSGATAYTRVRVLALPSRRSALAFFELGDPQGRPLLCLHGLSVSGLVFDPFHEHLAARGIRGIAPCLLGGVSLRDPSRTIEGMAESLIELMDLLGAPSFDMLGFSWGTLPQLALVARAPQRVRKAGFVGPMLPTRFLSPRDIDALKPDIRTSLAMAGRAPLLHRCLMTLVGRLPVSVLMKQFEDPSLSAAERTALAPGGALREPMAQWIEECRRSGSGFYTDAWRAMQGAPGYHLSDLATRASQVTVRLYVGEHDNVHLPVFAGRIAAAHRGVEVITLERARPAGEGVFRTVFSQGRTQILMAPGAGRMACMLYLREALDNLVSCEPA